MRSKKIKNNPAWKGITIGFTIAALLSFAFSFLCAICINNEYIDFQIFSKAQPIIQVLSAFIGCYICGVIVPDGKILRCAITALSYYLFLVGVSCLFFDGISGYFWVGILTSLIGFTGAILLCARGKVNTSRKRRKKAYC